ncbi:Disintegrin and metalloproteinase domain-containing protein 2 [Vulpes lagopus]
MYSCIWSRDLPCGKLICEYRGEEIINIPNATAIYAKINGRLCVAVDFPHDFTDGNKMWVKEGTVCGLNKVCKNHECVDAGYLDYDCTPGKCNERGICNNRKNCHCNPSYLPPNCQNTDDAWIGGSVDSGNFPPPLGQVSSGNLKVRVNLKSSQDNRIRHITSSYLQWTGQIEKKKKQKITALLDCLGFKTCILLF